jgi:hypothetical protein
MEIMEVGKKMAKKSKRKKFDIFQINYKRTAVSVYIMCAQNSRSAKYSENENKLNRNTILRIRDALRVLIFVCCA